MGDNAANRSSDSDSSSIVEARFHEMMNSRPSANQNSTMASVNSVDHGSSCSSTSTSDSDSDTSDEEVLPSGLSSKCFFCDERSVDPEFILKEHLKSHGVDFSDWVKKYKFDQLSYIRFINYFRYAEERCADINSAIADFEDNHTSILRDDAYMTPLLTYDGLLTYFIEEGTNGNEVDNDEECGGSVAMLRYQIKKLKERHADEIELLTSRLAIMRGTMERVLEDDKTPTAMAKKLSKGASDRDDAWYFESYDEIGIHSEMLFDKPRTEAYRKAILKNKNDFKGQTVLDVGCGTGILSMFAAKAGAKQVYAVDNSKILFDAIDIIKENELHETITCLFGKVENNVELERKEKFDILVSEWMGYFLLQEAMLKSVIYARDNYLKENGMLFPNAVFLYVSGADNQKGHFNTFGMWDNVYGFKMNAMRRRAQCTVEIDTIHSDEVVTDQAQLLELDLLSCTMNDTIIDKTFSLTARRDCVVTTLVGYFCAGFSIGSDYTNLLSTGPDSPPTHWKQTLFHLPKPALLKQGEKLSCHLKCGPTAACERNLKVDIDVGEDKLNQGLRYAFQ